MRDTSGMIVQKLFDLIQRLGQRRGAAGKRHGKFHGSSSTISSAKHLAQQPLVTYASASRGQIVASHHGHVGRSFVAGGLEGEVTGASRPVVSIPRVIDFRLGATVRTDALRFVASVPVPVSATSGAMRIPVVGAALAVAGFIEGPLTAVPDHGDLGIRA